MAIKYPENYSLGEGKVRAFPKKQYEKIKEIIDKVNDLDDGSIDVDSITPPSGVLTVNGDQEITGVLDVDGAFNTDGQAQFQQNVTIFGLLLLRGTPQTLTGSGAVNPAVSTTLLVTTGANAITLAGGTTGQIKVITMKTDGGDATLTPTGLRGGTTITFSAVGQTATLMYIDSAWIVLSLVGAVLA